MSSMTWPAATRLLVALSRNARPLLVIEHRPVTVIVQRLDQHLKNRVLRRRSFATSTYQNAVHEHHAASAPSHVEPSPLILQPPQATTSESVLETTVKAQLPQSCPGCGALTQEQEQDAAGYYSRDRRAIKQYLRSKKRAIRLLQTGASGPQEKIVEKDAVDSDDTAEQISTVEPGQANTPLCDRCHDLVHNSRGRSIAHPPLEALADSIAESPYKRNHIYHVLDAADFPMSLVPSLFTELTLARPRSQNRRSQHDFSSKPTISFIITRSDLLGSTKEMVDSMMTYFQSVLRQALGRTGRDMRLGNVHLVSAKRGWWTKEIKEEIWKRGGGNWMLGKVNVGKSNLFEVLFPKGSGDRAPVYAELKSKQEEGETFLPQDHNDVEETLLDENSLLPPAQPEVPFPVLPIVSSLPGTTASPIRLPFGNRKGELIDLPGLDRGDLEKYVKEENRLDLVMQHRDDVEQHIIKAGQSLTLGGGLVRITPQLNPEDPSTTVLAYPFVPLKAHVTSTEKAIAQQAQMRETGKGSVLAEGSGVHMASAGMFDMSTDVTKIRSGPILRSGIALSRLPFTVYATDVLIEGMGWVELVCQIRKRAMAASIHDRRQHDGPNHPHEGRVNETEESPAPPTPEWTPFSEHQTGRAIGEATSTLVSKYPQVEIFSPKGKHVSQRPSLQAWSRWESGRNGKGGGKLSRPRKAMKRRHN